VNISSKLNPRHRGSVFCSGALLGFSFSVNPVQMQAPLPLPLRQQPSLRNHVDYYP
jgi:hypothetical protein